MSRYLWPFTGNVTARVLLILAAIAAQQNVRAQPQDDMTYYYYWLTPGRIVGIALGPCFHLVEMFEN